MTTIEGLRCDIECPSGQYLDLDLDDKVSTCKTCGANTYSIPGAFIVGEMNDWDEINTEGDSNGDFAVELDCFYQNENYQLVENDKCTPWKSTGKTFKAWESQAENSYVAFKFLYPIYIVNKGYV